MNLFQMSFSGGILILVIIIIRAAAINRLSKKTFLILWEIAILRLLIPFSIPSALSVYSFVNKNMVINEFNKAEAGNVISNIYKDNNETILEPVSETMQFSENIIDNKPYFSVWFIIWFIGMIICMAFFLISYLHYSFKFKTSFPIENEFVKQWIKTHQIKRTVSIRESDRIFSPLTYGIFHPVILMPKNTDWKNTNQLQYILLHEYVHICRYDIIIKLILTITLCIHWFNPFVWLMYVLFNRDIELSCDETVIRQFGEESKTIYARMLINMEAKKSGLMPFSNNFSKNIIEERIKAVMKIKKTSLFTVTVSVMLIIFVITAFATSASNKNESVKNNSKKADDISGIDFSSEEYKKLLALKFDGYEDMSISEYQNKVWKMIDTEDYINLLASFSKDEKLYEIKEVSETASFLFNILEPITAQNWQVREFNGYTSTNYPSPLENALLEYVFNITIKNPDELKVGEYNDTRLKIKEKLNGILEERTKDELKDEELMNEIISTEISDFVKKINSDKLQIDIEYAFIPLTNYDEEIQNAIQGEWDKILAPYVPFGLSYRYDSSINDYKMYYKGKEIRGIYDELEGLWITWHSGVGANVYGDSAIELYAVYKENKLVGLREATVEEQEKFTTERQQTTDIWRKSSELQLEEDIEKREYPNGTDEDYKSLLVLMEDDYQNSSVADFNMDLLKWANENHERMERINIDTVYNDYQVPLTEDELSFIKLTVFLSGMENGKYVQSNYTGRKEEEPIFSQYLPGKTDKRNGRSAWCDLYYQFSYHIMNKDTLTIGERDRLINGMISSVQKFWDETSIDDMLEMSKGDIVKKLGEIAEEYSNDSLIITIKNDYVSFESMDEREID